MYELGELTLGLLSVAEMAVAKCSYICSGALLHRDIANALLVGAWVPDISPYRPDASLALWCRRYRAGSCCHALKGFICLDLEVPVVLWQMDGEAACCDGRAAELQPSAHPSRNRGQG